MHPPVCATKTVDEHSRPPQSSFETLPAGWILIPLPAARIGAENEPAKLKNLRGGTFQEEAGR